MQISGVNTFSPDLMRIDNQSIKNDNHDDKTIGSKSNKEQGEDLSSSEKAQVSKLQQADSQVRAHEAAHLAAGGGIVTGGANFSYTRGPDGKMYATAGEVPIDTSKESTPEATIQKARQIAAAAMAPADPSPTDYRVAASAVLMEMRARMELVREQMERINGEKEYSNASTQTANDTENRVVNNSGTEAA